MPSFAADCSANPLMCVSEANYKSQADALVAGGFRAAGYTTISIDDCWEQRSPRRDAQGRLAHGNFGVALLVLASFSLILLHGKVVVSIPIIVMVCSSMRKRPPKK